MADLRLEQLGEGVWIIPGVLSTDECYDQVARAEALGFEAASVRLSGGSQMLPGVRNNDRVEAHDPQLADLVWNRVSALVPQVEGEPATGLWDDFRYYRYEAGQRFKRHRDGVVHSEDGRASRLSFLVYLNEGATAAKPASASRTDPPSPCRRPPERR